MLPVLGFEQKSKEQISPPRLLFFLFFRLRHDYFVENSAQVEENLDINKF